MDKEIKDYILKLSGKASLLEELENDHEYDISINGETTEQTEVSNGDGSYNIVYKFKPKIIEIFKRQWRGCEDKRHSQKESKNYEEHCIIYGKKIRKFRPRRIL